MRRPPPAAGRARQEAAVAALAEALMAHGRGEPVRALEALASVVVNRMQAARARRAPPWWGVDLAAAVGAPGLFPAVARDAVSGPLAGACRRIAARAAAGSLPDPTGGALFWHRAGSPRPDDAPGEAAGEVSIRLGGLVFLPSRPAPSEAAEPRWTPAGEA